MTATALAGPAPLKPSMNATTPARFIFFQRTARPIPGSNIPRSNSASNTSSWPVHANGAAAGSLWNSGIASTSTPSGSRSWLDRSAMADLLDDDFRLAAKDTLYRCHGHLLVHREALFTHLKDRWAGLFGACYDILLYDLTSTYFEVDANGPVTEASRLKAFGYSRDKPPDCVQIVIALIVTPDGLPIGYEVMRGNTSDKTTLAAMLKTITDRYGKERRTWIMDRGIPTEETLHQMRQADPSVRYLVGTPKGRLTKLGKDLATKDWQQVKDDVHVKLLHRDERIAAHIFISFLAYCQHSPRPKSEIQSLWWRPFEKMNAISTIWIRNTH